jgi:hypothetical protein
MLLIIVDNATIGPVSTITLAATACVGNHRISEQFFVGRELAAPAPERPHQAAC